MIGTQSMMQPAVYSARVHQVGHGHLIDTAQPLKIRMDYNLVYQYIINSYKTINGVVNYFSERHYRLIVWGFGFGVKPIIVNC